MISHVLVWPRIFEGVRDVFAEENTPCELYFGWRGPTLKPQAPGLRKISFVPGDEGDAGKLGPPVLSEGARSFATFVETMTVYIYAVDPTNTADELKQYAAARLLHDVWFRATWYACAKAGTVGRFAVESYTWEVEKKERPHGACLRVVCTAEAKIPDQSYVFAPLDLAAELTGQLDDPNADPPGAPLGGVEETQTITKDDEEEP